jgi:hypothetical protein
MQAPPELELANLNCEILERGGGLKKWRESRREEKVASVRRRREFTWQRC